MRHRIKGRRLSRTASHRRAMRRNMVASLFTHGRIETTLPKAKELRPKAEKLITLGRTKTLANVRRALVHLGGDREAVARLFDEIGPSFQGRPGGYTRIVKLGRRRLGDQGALAYLELLTFVPQKQEEGEGGAKATKGKKAKEKAAAAGA